MSKKLFLKDHGLNILQTIHHHIHNLSYYGNFVERHQLYFNNRNAIKKFRHHRMHRSISHCLIPLALMVIFGVRALLVLCFVQISDTRQKRMLSGTELFPKGARHYIEITIVVWTLINISNVYIVLRKPIVYYKFMAVFVADPSSKIKPNLIGLNQFNYEKLENYRHFTIRSFDITIWSIAGGVGLIFISRTLSMDVPYSFEWFILLMWAFWVMLFGIYVSYTAYLYAVITMIIGCYLKLKQTSIIDKVNSLSQIIQTGVAPHHTRRYSILPQLFKLNRRYTTLIAEIADYNQFLTRGLSVIFFFYTLIIAYCVFLVIVSKVSNDIKRLYVGLFLAHVLSMTGLILACRNVCNNNQRFGAAILKFYMLTIESKIARFDSREVIKMQTFLENILSKKISFKLVNGYLIDSQAFYSVFYNITSFFFLIFKPY